MHEAAECGAVIWDAELVLLDMVMKGDEGVEDGLDRELSELES